MEESLCQCPQEGAAGEVVPGCLVGVEPMAAESPFGDCRPRRAAGSTPSQRPPLLPLLPEQGLYNLWACFGDADAPGAAY